MARTVGDILKNKGTSVFTIDPERSVADAVTLLVEKNIGSLLVLDRGEVAGIITERDVLRQCAKQASRLGQIKVRDVMTRELLTGHPDDTLTSVQQTMTERRIRHLPILEMGIVAGMVSIGDVVKALLADTAEEAHELRGHLAGHYVVT